MKKLIALCLSVVLVVFPVAGCEDKGGVPTKSNTTLSGMEKDSDTNNGDSSNIENSKSSSRGLSEKEFQSQLNDFQENLASQRSEFEKNDTGNYSSNDEAVWQYCQDRWKYYDSLENGYSGDKHTQDVFNDAASRFGISTSEAKRIWNSVDQAKLGLK